ncbi:hypothetical protein DA2_2647 [Desulfovibrio sp. A2]|nr:hypothetical protein DA2_2647 [Desulfovibrio sp. A2]
MPLDSVVLPTGDIIRWLGNFRRSQAPQASDAGYKAVPAL